MDKETTENVETFFDNMESSIRQEMGAQIEAISRNFKQYEIDIIQASLDCYKESLLKEQKKLKKKPKTVYAKLLMDIDTQINLTNKLYYNFDIGASKHIDEDADDNFKLVEV